MGMANEQWKTAYNELSRKAEAMRKEVLSLLAKNSTLKNQRRQAEYSTALRCAEIARARGDVVTAVDIRREFGLTEAPNAQD
jgi:hypothetical protein